MKAPPIGFEPHPAIGAFILTAAAVLMGYNAYSIADDWKTASNGLEVRWWKIAGGHVLWVIGTVFTARARYATWGSGMGYGLLLLPGLLLLLWRTRRNTRHRYWAGEDLEGSEKQLRRRFRPMKALY